MHEDVYTCEPAQIRESLHREVLTSKRHNAGVWNFHPRKGSMNTMLVTKLLPMASQPETIHLLHPLRDLR